MKRILATLLVTAMSTSMMAASGDSSASNSQQDQSQSEATTSTAQLPKADSNLSARVLLGNSQRLSDTSSGSLYTTLQLDYKLDETDKVRFKHVFQSDHSDLGIQDADTTNFYSYLQYSRSNAFQLASKDVSLFARAYLPSNITNRTERGYHGGLALGAVLTWELPAAMTLSSVTMGVNSFHSSPTYLSVNSKTGDVEVNQSTNFTLHQIISLAKEINSKLSFEQTAWFYYSEKYISRSQANYFILISELAYQLEDDLSVAVGLTSESEYDKSPVYDPKETTLDLGVSMTF